MDKKLQLNFEYINKFKKEKTGKYGNLYFNDFKKQILVDTILTKNAKLYNYTDLKTYRANKPTAIEVTDSSQKKGGITRGLLGSMIAGHVGAVIGTSTAKTKYKTKTKVVGDLKVILYFNDDKHYSIDFFLENKLDHFCIKLDAILEDNKKVSDKINDPYDEIQTLKHLLDDGIITEDEFSTKKKKLLDL